MSNPAARVGDMHTCPVSDGPKPHVGGPIQPPGCTTVLTCGPPAARATDRATCTGPPDFIVVGSSTVLIGNKMAAYMGCPTMHGGQVIGGCPLVLVGGPPAGATLGNPAAAAAVFPGAQNHGNCGVQSAQQIIHQATGVNHGEEELLQWSIDHGYADDDSDPSQRGATSASTREHILDEHGVPSHRESQDMRNIQQAVAERRGVITSHDAGALWNDPHYDGAGHAVNVTGLEYGSDGSLRNVIINDTGTGHNSERIPADRFGNSLRPSGEANVTDNPVW
ncbi:MAG TPA: hypothetical protein ENG51_19295 [Deltaproteobacteria bacterium]|nr:hypothetical protein [Deltaproteobacteria bacterium]